MRDEREGAVWQQVIENLVYLDDVFVATPVQESPSAPMADPFWDRSWPVLGWQPKPDDDAGTLRLRNALIDTLGRLDDAETTALSQDNVCGLHGNALRAD